MTRRFTTFQQQSLTKAAIQHFDCEEIPFGFGSGKEPKERRKKRQSIEKICDRFFAVMNSENPPKTLEEACKIAVPIGLWILSFVIKTIAESVIAWLWERSQD